MGAILPLDLRLLGAWRGVALGPLYRVLSRVAATGLLLAAASGTLLFAVRATEYAALGVFRAKMALVALGALHALALHLGTRFPDVEPAKRRLAGAVSLLTWPTALICGRLIAFV